jgi:MoxR-like ATPase
MSSVPSSQQPVSQGAGIEGGKFPSVPAALSEVPAVERLKVAREMMMREMGKVIVGQEDVIDSLLVAMFSRGHCLLVGVPGLAKTLMISTLAKVLNLRFSRIQFTPDLMPSDITGTDILQDDPQTGGGRRVFHFVRGPIFTNLLLADEINRTPPKTQAALLQAMQEYQVTTGGGGGKTYPLEPPFFVLATQNPVEQEGTYPLPEAQLDRFMFMVKVGYPRLEEERQIVKATTSETGQELQPVLTAADIVMVQKVVRKVPVSDHIVDYAVNLVRATRPHEKDTPEFINNWLTWGAGPRAAQYLVLGAKARAVTRGRLNVSAEDIRQMAKPVLRHRLITNFNADAEGVDADAIIDKLIATVPEPGPEAYR